MEWRANVRVPLCISVGMHVCASCTSERVHMCFVHKAVRMHVLRCTSVHTRMCVSMHKSVQVQVRVFPIMACIRGHVRSMVSMVSMEVLCELRVTPSAHKRRPHLGRGRLWLLDLGASFPAHLYFLHGWMHHVV